MSLINPYYDEATGDLTEEGKAWSERNGGIAPPRGNIGYGLYNPYGSYSPEKRRSQGLLRQGAGVVDMLRGRGMQRDAEANIEEIGASIDELRGRMENMRPPSLMGDEALAAATRNAAILGQQFQADPSAELAAAQTAIDAGSDPATVARLLAEMQTQEQMRDQQMGQQAFQQGLQYGQQDAMNQYQFDQGLLQNEYDDLAQQLNQNQQESLMGQQLQQQGAAGLTKGITQFATNYDRNLGGDDATFLQTLGANVFGAEKGMKVQKTPGEFDHDTNDMILMAQTRGGLVDTGIRQTGGEFVLNPDQAEGLEDAYEEINPKEIEAAKNGEMSEDLFNRLIALYEAARFLDEPQFDEDYVA